MTRHALIWRGRVVDVIDLASDDAPFRSDLDGSIWVEITHRDPQPGVGWSFDGITFTNPSQS